MSDSGATKERVFDTLKDKHKKFVLEYVKDLNATQAYIRAGYSKKGARQSASNLLSNTDVKAAVQEKCAEMFEEDIEEAKLKTRRLLEIVAHSDLKDVCSWGPDGVEIIDSKKVDGRPVKSITMQKTTRRYVKLDEIETTVNMRVEMKDSLKAAEQLAKIFGLYSDGDVHTGDVYYVNAPGTEEWDGRTE